MEEFIYGSHHFMLKTSTSFVRPEYLRNYFSGRKDTNLVTIYFCCLQHWTVLSQAFLSRLGKTKKIIHF